MTVVKILSQKQIQEIVKKEVERRVSPLEKEIDILRLRLNDLEKIIK